MHLLKTLPEKRKDAFVPQTPVGRRLAHATNTLPQTRPRGAIGKEQRAFGHRSACGRSDVLHVLESCARRVCCELKPFQVRGISEDTTSRLKEN